MRAKIFFIIIICLGVGLLAGYFTGHSSTIASSTFAPVDVRADSDEYKFINPLLFTRTKKDLYSDEYKDLNASLAAKINTFTKSGTASKASVYFRDLNTSHWTGINENEKYDPSSLLKVILLTTYLKKSLTDSELLSKKLYYKGPDETGQSYKATEQLKAGNQSILDLLKVMIVESDNIAKDVLMTNDTKGFEDTYRDFRLPIPENEDTNDYMSARSYSVIFRSLFNSTYLPWNVSEQTLSLLSFTKFNQGIVAGVPWGTTVAHKFGEHTYVYADAKVESRELHDCGIVYYPGKPYLLCIMTRGQDFPKLEKVIAGLSEIVYSYVKNSEAK